MTESRRWVPWTVTAMAIAAGVLYAFGAAHANLHDYYTPAVVSMSNSWHAFVFGSYDSAGWAGVDKIPGALWPQAASVAVFGPSTWSVVLPEALATVATIVVVYLAASRWRGRIAGLAAAAVYATMPLAAALAKSNVPEVWFGLALALAAYFAIRAVQSGRIWWLIAAGLAVSAGFQVKMLEAWMVYPALAIAYLVGAPRAPWTRIWHVAVAGAISILASLWWIALVWLTPATSRPWVGGTADDSAWSMVFGYNGLGRVTGAQGSFVASFAGDAGLSRLVGPQVSVDVAWFLPLAVAAALLGVVLGLRAWKDGAEARARLGGYLLFGLWLIPVALVMAYSAGIHTFYVLAFAPAIATLVGAIAAEAWDALPGRAARTWIVAAILLQTAWTAWLVVRAGDHSWLLAVVPLFSLAAVALTLAGRRAGLVIASIGLLLAPAAWAVGTIAHGDAINPSAGTSASMGPGGGAGTHLNDAGGPPPGMQAPSGMQAPTGMPPGGGPATSGPGNSGPGSSGPGGAVAFDSSQARELRTWLESHSPRTQYLVAADSRVAGQLLLAQAPGVIALGGGFNASDPTPTAAELQSLVGNGQLRYVIASDDAGMRGPGEGAPGGAMPGMSGTSQQVTQERTAWITANCAAVTDAPAAAGTVYDCAAEAADG